MMGGQSDACLTASIVPCSGANLLVNHPEVLMRNWQLAVLGFGLGLFLFRASAFAQCTKDTDCTTGQKCCSLFGQQMCMPQCISM